jgi:hypothetical protein
LTLTVRGSMFLPKCIARQCCHPKWDGYRHRIAMKAVNL